jgi:hypothetical protein
VSVTWHACAWIRALDFVIGAGSEPVTPPSFRGLAMERLAAEIEAEVDPALIPRGDITWLWRIYAVLIRAKGIHLQASDVHDVWTAWAFSERPGWGALLPIEELDPSAQAKDEPYVAALRRVAARHSTVGEAGQPRG